MHQVLTVKFQEKRGLKAGFRKSEIRFTSFIPGQNSDSYLRKEWERFFFEKDDFFHLLGVTFYSFSVLTNVKSLFITPFTILPFAFYRGAIV